MKIRTKLYHPVSDDWFVFEGKHFDGTIKSSRMWIPRIPNYRCVLDEMVEFTSEDLIAESFNLFDFGIGVEEFYYWQKTKPSTANQLEVFHKYRGKLRSAFVGDMYAFQHPVTKEWRIDLTEGWGYLNFSKQCIQELFAVNDDIKDVVTMQHSNLFALYSNIEKVRLLSKYFNSPEYLNQSGDIESFWTKKEDAHSILERI